MLRREPAPGLGYGDRRGAEPLRVALADYLGRVRGVVADPGQVMVCAGFSHGLDLVCRAVRARGARRIAFEDPCLAAHRAIAEAAGLEIVNLEVDQHGARVEHLLQQPLDVVVVTPTHQFPLGVALHPERRAALARWASATGGLIVEDDYDGEFRYDRQPVGALQALAPQLVVYGGTASKSLAPGLRLGWLVLPRHLVEPIGELRRFSDRHASVLDQLALAELITSGGFDRHIRRVRAQYRRRRDRLVAALQQHVPMLRPGGLMAGLHVLLRLPEYGPSEGQVLALLAGRGVAVYGLGDMWHNAGTRPDPALVIGYGTPPPHAFEAALDAFIASLRELFVGHALP